MSKLATILGPLSVKSRWMVAWLLGFLVAVVVFSVFFHEKLIHTTVSCFVIALLGFLISVRRERTH